MWFSSCLIMPNYSGMYMYKNGKGVKTKFYVTYFMFSNVIRTMMLKINNFIYFNSTTANENGNLCRTRNYKIKLMSGLKGI
jgi:hypothetical protein